MIGGCLRRLFVLAVLFAAGAAVWHFRGAIVDGWRQLRGAREGAPLRTSAELAAAAESKLAALGSNSAPERVTLTEAELQSLVDYRLSGALPGFVASPRVRLRDGRIRIEARLMTRRLPDLPELGDFAAFIPDTTDITATGQLIPLGPGRVGLSVAGISVAGVPLPDRLIPLILRRLGRADEAGLPADAFALPLPAGATAAYVHGDSMVLVGGRN
nr:MAG: hypothetical protein DIU52_07055 [bacterium]